MRHQRIFLELPPPPPRHCAIAFLLARVQRVGRVLGRHVPRILFIARREHDVENVYVRADGGRLPNRPTMIRDSLEKLTLASRAEMFSSFFFFSFFGLLPSDKLI